MAHDVICVKNTWWLWSSQFCDDTKRMKTNQIIILQRHITVDEETFNVNIKIAEKMQNSWNLLIEKSILLTKWQTTVIIAEIFILLSGDWEILSKSGVSHIIQESWQHCSGMAAKNTTGSLNFTVGGGADS